MNRFRAAAGPVLLAVIVTAFFWKLLTKQYTWLDHPDMAYQVLPWYQFQAERWHQLQFPLWDPHEFGGQPLIGQLQPGAAYPLNWPLFLLPLHDGHFNPMWMHLYFIVTHILAAVFCYWLCVDLGCSLPAAMLGGLAFSLSGVTGNLGWPQMLNGAIWIPAVVMFCLRAIRGQRPFASATAAGAFLGISFLSGHHQIPIFTALTAAGLWIYFLWRERLRGLATVAAFGIATFLSGALQLLPAYEYAIRSIRFVGTPNAVQWGQSVPYSQHEQYSLTPLGILGLVLPHVSEGDTFIGLTVLTLALVGFIAYAGKLREARLLGAIAVGGLLLALGRYSVFHGMAYLFVPLVEKARSPIVALTITQFALAVLAAFGLDAIRRGTVLGRRWMVTLTVAGALPWPFLAIESTLRMEISSEYERFAIFGLVALALAALLGAVSRGKLSLKAATVCLILLTVFELGTVTGPNYRSREHPGGFLAELDKNQDIVAFLRARPDFTRLEVDTQSAPANLGDWDGIDTMQCYLGGITSNVAQLESGPLQDGAVAAKLFSLTHYLGSKPVREGQQEVFRGASGLTVYRNPDPLPRLWTVHESQQVDRRNLVEKLQAADLSRQALLTSTAPQIDRCAGEDRVQLVARTDTRLQAQAAMSCRGLLIFSETFYPGWEASVDGRTSQVFEADGALRAVVVDAGAHSVELRYRPWSVYLGGLLTAIGLAAAAWISMRGKTTEVQSTGAARSVEWARK